MRGFVRLVGVVLAAAVVFISCKKDENTGRMSFNAPAAYLSAPGTSVSVGFTTYHIKLKTLSISNKPTGWPEPVLNTSTGTVTITAPDDLEKDDVVESGNVVLAGVSNEGTPMSATIFVGVVSTVDLSDKPANSYVVSKKSTRYLIDATSKGETTNRFAPSSVKILWQTASTVLKHVQLEKDDKVSFFVGEDGGSLKAGNAVLGAYSVDGELLWTWHVWVADYDAQAAPLTLANGYTMMDRNLGALDNKNTTEAEILASYGLYYQWGRRTPFVGPLTFDAQKGSSASMFNHDGKRVYITTKPADATTGTSNYAEQNPLCFITGTKESYFDWLLPSIASVVDPRWSDAQKTENDPCPRGWKVAPAAAFAGLRIADDLTADYSLYEKKYGWTLTDGAVSSLFMGLGRRVYTNGSIQNAYIPPTRSVAMEAQPWEGLYWTSGEQGTQSTAFYFWFYKAHVDQSGIEPAAPYYRSNGMQVRCVKVN